MSVSFMAPWACPKCQTCHPTPEVNTTITCGKCYTELKLVVYPHPRLVPVDRDQ